MVTDQVSLDHVLGDLVTEGDELVVGQVLGDLVVESDVAENLASPGAADAVDVLEGVLDPLVVGDLHASNTQALDAQATSTTLLILMMMMLMRVRIIKWKHKERKETAEGTITLGKETVEELKLGTETAKALPETTTEREEEEARGVASDCAIADLIPPEEENEGRRMGMQERESLSSYLCFFFLLSFIY